MGRCDMSVEQACARQQVATNLDATNPCAEARLESKPRKHLGVFVKLCAPTAEDKDDVIFITALGRYRAVDSDAVARDHSFAVERMKVPLV